MDHLKLLQQTPSAASGAPDQQQQQQQIDAINVGRIDGGVDEEEDEGSSSSVLKLKGLPYTASEVEIRDFFKDYSVRSNLDAVTSQWGAVEPWAAPTAARSPGWFRPLRMTQFIPSSTFQCRSRRSRLSMSQTAGPAAW